MDKIVAKFGGSNLRCKEDIFKTTEVIKRYNSPLIVVISALYGITDFLADAIIKIKDGLKNINNVIAFLLETHQETLEKYIDDEQYKHECFKKLRNEIKILEKILADIHNSEEVQDYTEDIVLSYGERLSSLLLEFLLKDMKIKCERVLPETLGLYTDGEHGNATIDFSISESKIRRKLSEEKIYIIPGFYGISHDNKITTFGRGGSDYTAAAIARCIDADFVDIWKDVPGFMNADPNVLNCTKVIPKLTYREASEMAYFGAHILHPRTVEPLQDKDIQIRIFNIKDFPGKFSALTYIGNDHYINGVIKGITHTDDIAVLRLKNPEIGIKPEILSYITATLCKSKIYTKSVITSQTSINIWLSKKDTQKIYKIIDCLGLSESDKLVCMDNISLIVLVGEGMIEIPGIATRIFNALSRHRINVQLISLGVSEVAGYFIVNKKDKNETIKAIHKEFFS